MAAKIARAPVVLGKVVGSGDLTYCVYLADLIGCIITLRRRTALILMDTTRAAPPFGVATEPEWLWFFFFQEAFRWTR